MAEGRSIDGGGWFPDKHRNFKCRKVENGWQIEAAFTEEYEYEDDRSMVSGLPKKKRKRAIKKEFVFPKGEAGFEEMMLWIRGYMSAKREELQEGG